MWGFLLDSLGSVVGLHQDVHHDLHHEDLHHDDVHHDHDHAVQHTRDHDHYRGRDQPSGVDLHGGRDQHSVGSGPEHLPSMSLPLQPLRHAALKDFFAGPDDDAAVVAATRATPVLAGHSGTSASSGAVKLLQSTSSSAAGEQHEAPAAAGGQQEDSATAAHLSASSSPPGWGSGIRHALGSGGSFLFSDSQKLLETVRSAPPALVVAAHAASVVVVLPGHLLIELAQGYLFGLQRGLMLALAGKSLGVTLAYVFGRSLRASCDISEAMRSRMEAWPKAKTLAQGVERQGALSVVLLTLAPVPGIVKNYAIPLLTEIPWSVYLPAKFIGLLPPTAAHVYAGTLATSGAELGHGVEAVMHVMAPISVLASMGLLGVVCGYLLQGQCQEGAGCGAARELEEDGADGCGSSAVGEPEPEEKDLEEEEEEEGGKAAGWHLAVAAGASTAAAEEKGVLHH